MDGIKIPMSELIIIGDASYLHSIAEKTFVYSENGYGCIGGLFVNARHNLKNKESYFFTKDDAVAAAKEFWKDYQNDVGYFELVFYRENYGWTLMTSETDENREYIPILKNFISSNARDSINRMKGPIIWGYK